VKELVPLPQSCEELRQVADLHVGGLERLELGLGAAGASAGAVDGLLAGAGPVVATLVPLPGSRTGMPGKHMMNSWSSGTFPPVNSRATILLRRAATSAAMDDVFWASWPNNPDPPPEATRKVSVGSNAVILMNAPDWVGGPATRITVSAGRGESTGRFDGQRKINVIIIN